MFSELENGTSSNGLVDAVTECGVRRDDYPQEIFPQSNTNPAVRRTSLVRRDVQGERLDRLHHFAFLRQSLSCDVQSTLDSSNRCIE